jgi:hypothetical protein
MAKAKSTLLSSGPTLNDMREAAERFYCGMSITLAPNGDDLWNVVRTNDGKTLDGMQVLRKRGRFRLEMVS